MPEVEKAGAEASGKQKAGKGSMVVVDFGKQKRKQIKELRAGEGPLLAKVEETIAELRGQGVLSESSQTLVVVVKEKPRGGSLNIGSLGGLLR